MSDTPQPPTHAAAVSNVLSAIDTLRAQLVTLRGQVAALPMAAHGDISQFLGNAESWAKQHFGG